MVGLINRCSIDLGCLRTIDFWSKKTLSFAALALPFPLSLLKACALKQILEVKWELSSKEEERFHV